MSIWKGRVVSDWGVRGVVVWGYEAFVWDVYWRVLGERVGWGRGCVRLKIYDVWVLLVICRIEALRLGDIVFFILGVW